MNLLLVYYRIKMYFPQEVWYNIKCYQIEYKKHWNIKIKESFNEIENMYELYSSVIHHTKNLKITYYLNKKNNNVNKKLTVCNCTSI